MVAEYFKELCGSIQILDCFGNLKSVASVANECAVFFLLLAVLREGNNGNALFAEIYAVVYQLLIGVQSYQPSE